MPNSLTATGLTTATQAELLAQYTAALQAIYGPTVNLASNTPDGQWMNIFIQSVLDLEDLMTQVYNSFDPDNAIGVVLDQRVAINGIQRQGGTFSQTQIAIVISGSVNLFGLDQSVEQIYTVSDNAGNLWQLITSATGATSGNYLFQAANPGAVLTTPNTITIAVTVVLGVTSVNNPSVQTITGITSETDAALKVRRQNSVSIPSQGFFQSLRAALLNINGISSALVLENDSASTDVDGIPGHSIWVIVAGSPSPALALPYNLATTYSYNQLASSGGINYISVANNNTGNLVSNPAYWRVFNPVAQAIYTYRNAGCGMYNSMDAGAQSYAVTQIDGSSFTVYWDTVVPESLFVKFTATSLNGINPPDLAGIKTYLVANFAPIVDGEVDVNELGTLVQIADSNTLATFPSQGFATAVGGPYTLTRSPTSRNNQFQVTAPNIILLPIILSCPSGTPVLTLQGDGSYKVTNTTVSTASGGSTIQFSALGGFGTYVYSVFSGAGSINSSSGLYTSATVGTDVIHVTDGNSNIGTATVSVT